MINIAEYDKDFLRILWVDDINLMTLHLYFIVSAMLYSDCVQARSC